ncbi:MAG: hypothetical protein HRT87_08710 [Legionellales bacterium]|nr:hypothetical protein [Legionellales bacterium]
MSISINNDSIEKPKYKLKPIYNEDIRNIDFLRDLSNKYKEHFDEIIFERVGHGLGFFISTQNFDLYINLLTKMLKKGGKFIYKSYRTTPLNNLHGIDYGIIELLANQVLVLAKYYSKIDAIPSMYSALNKNKTIDKNDYLARTIKFLTSKKHRVTVAQYKFLKNLYIDLLEKNGYRNIVVAIEKDKEYTEYLKSSGRDSLAKNFRYSLIIRATKKDLQSVNEKALLEESKGNLEKSIEEHVLYYYSTENLYRANIDKWSKNLSFEINFRNNHSYVINNIADKKTLLEYLDVKNPYIMIVNRNNMIATITNTVFGDEHTFTENLKQGIMFSAHIEDIIQPASND